MKRATILILCAALGLTLLSGCKPNPCTDPACTDPSHHHAASAASCTDPNCTEPSHGHGTGHHAETHHHGRR